MVFSPKSLQYNFYSATLWNWFIDDKTYDHGISVLVREDSQIDFAMGNVFLNVSVRHPPCCLETFKSKINNHFKIGSLTDVDDA